MTRGLESLEFDLPDADCLLVVPPLAHLTWPALGVHLLQACAREAGFRVAILYMNAAYADRVGPVAYAGLCNAPVHWLLGERLFARAAHGAPPLGYRTEDFLASVEAHNARVEKVAIRYVDHLSDSSGVPIEGGESRFPLEDLLRYEDLAITIAERLAAAIAARRYPIVGVTTTFDQTSAGIALLQRVKAARPETITVMGGANCDGPMAEGVRSLTDAVDILFSGESEGTFVAFLRAWRAGTPPTTPVIHGAPCKDLDALPTPSFASYFDQLPAGLGDTPTWVLYETSRGCWWGAKQHCTFCGLNAMGMAFREKSPARVVTELREILAEAPTYRVCMTDNIMPHRYHASLIPRLPADLPDIRIFYEQKANLTLSQVKKLFDAGCRSIQPGIEALDSGLLRLVRKGLLARQNVALLRYARTVGMLLKWNLLWGFPGDDAESFRRTAALLPLLRHLNPPQALAHLHLDRFSPYLEHPEAHGITDLRPLDGYGDVFPEHT
ncbi:MAG: RiPP maturation radical SAM C-methyltransferase, partial [Deltaproteobacteria bacterium]|nr:RiPP maturation radical SAM C-methyltransferase [Deltaproteobacteria bacterium]